MIKKISAIVLALVLCLSVVVVPTSALDVTVADGMNMTWALEWDKATYSAGETAYLNIYMKVADGYEIGAGSVIIGLNSSVISPDDNAVADVMAASSSSDVWQSYWKSPEAENVSTAWLAATVDAKVDAKNTAEEQALYDQYFKITIAKAGNAGTHENAAANKNGLPSDEINAVEGPMYTLAFVVGADVADGTALNAAITSGSLTCSPVQTTLKYYKTPGSLTTQTAFTAATIDVSSAVAEATIGSAGKEYETSIVSYWKDQIKMENSDYTSFSIRHLAVISKADWEANFGTDEDNDVAGTKNITDIGFILATGNGSFDKDVATDWLEAGATDNTFTKMPVKYVSTGMSGNEGNYVYSVVITGCTDKNASLSSLGYVVWTDDAGATHYSYFENVQTETFTELYDGYVAAH